MNLQLSLQFKDFLKDIQTNHAPEIVCLITQTILSLHTYMNIRTNWDKFPVKQLSPILSIVALGCFLILNVLSLATKIIQTKQGYYHQQRIYPDCGQCRLYQHNQLIILAFFYQGLRQLPLLIFIFKTLRVCICYWVDYKTNINKYVVSLFKSQTKLLLLCIIMALILVGGQIIAFEGGSQTKGMLIFQFFCPKESSPFDWVVSILRFSLMGFVYAISIYTYDQLDFKRFLFMIFIINNTEVVLRSSLVLAMINETTYHQFYYHSLIMHLCGTCILFFYSRDREQQNKPLSKTMLQSFQLFVTTSLGVKVLMHYCEHQDSKNQNSQLKLTLEAFIKVNTICLYSQQYKQFNIKNELDNIAWILQNVELFQTLQQKQKLIKQCRNKQVQPGGLRIVQQKLRQYCHYQIFYNWKKTQSCKYLQRQFQNNTIINVRMHSLDIQLR